MQNEVEMVGFWQNNVRSDEMRRWKTQVKPSHGNANQ